MLLNKINSFIHSKKEGKKCMKTTGITRRIDELGRVVIPKEIRKNLHIKPGELLEIFLSDTETISFKKYNTINKEAEFINMFINSLSYKTNSNVFVTNLDEIVFSNLKEALNCELCDEFDMVVSNKIKKDFKLTKNYILKEPYSIFPISPNGDLAGYLIFENLDNNLKVHEELIKFTTLFLENYFENI